MRAPFHLAIHVDDLDAARTFWVDVVGCGTGRSAETWLDVDLFGNELSLHLGEPFPTSLTGRVGDQLVPMPHLGVVLDLDAWRALARRLRDADVPFVLEPQVRFAGEPGEQWTLFVRDPAGNPVEFKGFADPGAVFAG